MTKKILIFVYSCFTTICLGLIYGWSVFVLPLEKDLGWDRTETAMTFTLSVIFLSLAVMLGGFYNKSKDKPFISMSFSGILIFIGFFTASYSTIPMDFYIRYGILVGFGIGFAYVEILSVLSKWFQKNLGIATGTIMMCYGLGAMILGTICTALIESLGWHLMFKYIGIIFGIMVIMEGVFLHMGNNSPCTDGIPSSKKQSEALAVPPSQMLRCPEFYLIFIYIIMIASAGLCLMNHIVPCAISIGISAASATTMMGCISVFNGIGRLLYGFLYDKIGIAKALSSAVILFVITAVLAIFAVKISNSVLLMITCALFGILYGSAPPTSSVIASKFYGIRYYSANYGILSMPPAFAAFIGPYIAGIIYASSGSYNATFYMLAGFAIIAFILACLFISISGKKGRNL